MKYQTLEDRLLERIYPRLQQMETRVTDKVTKRLIDVINELVYPPESMLTKNFIKRVKEADRRIKSGKSKIYSHSEFKKKFLGK